MNAPTERESEFFAPDYIWDLSPGDHFMRDRITWGTEHIEVVEIVESETVGKIAIYRHWLVDDDGNEWSNAEWAPQRKQLLLRRESTLKAKLNSGHRVERPDGAFHPVH